MSSSSARADGKYNSKRQRLDRPALDSLQECLHDGGLTMSALSRVAKSLLNETFGDVSIYNVLKDVNREHFDRVKMDLPLELTSGAPFAWSIASPVKLMELVISASPVMQSMLLLVAEAQGSQGSFTVGIIVGYDEFTPGNVKKPHNERKTMVLSFTVADLEIDALANELFWFTPVAVRSAIISNVKGGWSRMLKDLLKLMFGGGPQSLDGAGVSLVLGGRNYLMFGALKCLISDNDGLRMGLDVKGHAGKRPCFSCYNLWSKGTPLSHDGHHITIECPDFARCEPLQQGTLEDFVRELQDAHGRHLAGTMNAESWVALQKALGINYNADGLLFDIALCRRIGLLRTVRRDWMHGYLQNGVAHDELQLFLQTCSERCGLTLADWRAAFRGNFEFRDVHRWAMRRLWSFFADWVKNFRLHCDASSVMAILFIIGHFAEVVLEARAEVAAECASIIALCRAVRLATRVKAFPRDARLLEQLREAIKKHFQLSKVAYSQRVVLPKHHYNLHIPDQVVADKFLCDMFVLERHHIAIKRVAEPIRNTKIWEVSLLGSVCTWHVKALSACPADMRERLLDPVKNYEGHHGWRISAKAVANGRVACVDDVLLKDHAMSAAHRISAIVEERGTVYVIADCWALVESKKTSSLFRKTDGVLVTPLRDAILAHTWYVDGGYLHVLQMC